MSDQKLKGGVMIIGSLYWDNDPYRLKLRQKFLDMDGAQTVDAPIRYGRFSKKRETYTMVFSKDLSPDEFGKAKLISLKDEYCTLEKVEEANRAIINAEHKDEFKYNRYNWGWGCLSVLFKPGFDDQLMLDLWDRNFDNGFDPNHYRVGTEQPIVSSKGQLQIPWSQSYNDYDFILVTATKPEVEKYPSPDDLTEIFKKDDHYFLGNYEFGMRTFQDGAIIKPLMISKGFKHTKAGWIPKDWMSKSLKKLFSFKNGVNADKEKYGQGIKFINVMEILQNDEIIENSITGSITLEQKIIDQNLIEYGDVLFNRTSEVADEIGMSAVYFGQEPVTFGGFVIRGKPINKEIEILFRKYCFSSFEVRKQIILKGQGVVRANIGQKDLEKVEVPLPPLPEQKAIAQVLSTWDKAIENLTQLVTEKQQKKKALMQQLLTGKKRFPGFDGEWMEVKLGEYFTERKESKRPDLPLLSIGSSGVYPQTDSNKKDTSNSDKAKYKRICPDDIGYNTMRMWQGRSALSSLEGIVSPAYTIVTPKENADVLFFSYLFKFPYVVHRFFRNSQGLVDDTLNCKFKDFAIVKVMVPPTKEEQTKIAQVLRNTDAEIKVLEQKKVLLQDQKKGLMQQLLTGKKRLKLTET